MNIRKGHLDSYFLDFGKGDRLTLLMRLCGRSHGHQELFLLPVSVPVIFFRKSSTSQLPSPRRAHLENNVISRLPDKLQHSGFHHPLSFHRTMPEKLPDWALPASRLLFWDPESLSGVNHTAVWQAPLEDVAHCLLNLCYFRSSPFHICWAAILMQLLTCVLPTWFQPVSTLLHLSRWPSFYFSEKGRLTLEDSDSFHALPSSDKGGARGQPNHTQPWTPK